MSIVDALYLVLLAAVAGYVLIRRIPSLLHTPMMSGSNFIHGIVLAGAMLALSAADGTVELTIGFVAVMAASANVFGGFVVTDRILKIFDEKGFRNSAFLLSEAGKNIKKDTAPGKEDVGIDVLLADEEKSVVTVAGKGVE